MATSYTNPGGSGDRIGTITITAVGTLVGGPNPLINGNVADTSSYFSGVSRLSFQFGYLKVIDEAKLYQSNATAHGTWKWQGSNDGTAWTDIGGTFTLGGTTTQTFTTLAGNTTAYRHYRLELVSGATSKSPWISEFEFKIDGPDPTPIAHWLFDEATGTTAADASGNGHTATLSNGTWDTVRKVQGAAALANTDGGVGATFTPINLGTVYTVAHWINGWDGSNDWLGLGGMSGQGYSLYADGTNFYVQVGSGNYISIAHGGGLTGARHVATVRQGTTIRFYKDGVALAPITLPSNTALSLDSISGYAGGTFPLVGAMDDVRIYDAALTAAQIQALVDLYAPPSTAWVSQVAVEVLAETEPIAGRLSQAAVEVLVGGPLIEGRLSQVAVEVLLEPKSDLPALVSQVVVEVLMLTASKAGIGPWLGDGGGGSIWIE